ATRRARPTAVRAHSGVAPASPQAGTMPMLFRSTDRLKPIRSVSDTTLVATSSTAGQRAGALDGTAPNMTARPDSTNSPIASRSAACNEPTSTDIASILLRCKTFQGIDDAQVCTETSVPAAVAQMSRTVTADDSSMAATGLSL